MAEKSSVFKQKLKHKGFFNFNELYNFCYSWMIDEGYQLSEDEYSEKLASNGKEVVIKWVAKKKITDYFRNFIELKWRIIGLNDAEVDIGGKKDKTNKGDLSIEFSADLERDWDDKWAGKPFNKFLRGIYDKYVIKTTVDEYEERLKERVSEFFNQVKGFLLLEGQK